jgi:hypothetical protein
MDSKTFTLHMAYLQKMYGHILDDGIRAMYWNQMKDWDAEKFQAAVKRIAETFIPSRQLPFPLLPHFLQAVGEDEESKGRVLVQRIREAVQRFGRIESVSFGDRALHSVIQSVGGWDKVCNWNDETWRFKESSFIKSYVAAARAGEEGPEYLPGSAERHNMMNGFASYVKGPMLITGEKPRRLPLPGLGENKKLRNDSPDSIIKGIADARGI